MYIPYDAQSNYHFVEITLSSDGQLWWYNDAGSSWALFYENGLLHTAVAGEYSDSTFYCPYGYQELDVEPDGTLIFLNEPYYPVYSHSNEEVDETGCKDSAGGHTDSYGDGCEWYDYVPSDCG